MLLASSRNDDLCRPAELNASISSAAWNIGEIEWQFMHIVLEEGVFQRLPIETRYGRREHILY